MLWLLDPLRKRPPPTSLLDQVLLRWNDTDVYTVRDFLDAGLLCLGRPGSGKTTSMWQLLEALVSLRFPDGSPGSGGLIVCATRGERQVIIDLFARCSRSADLLIFEPGGMLRFNVLDYLVQRGESTREITKVLTTIAETLRGNDTRGGEQGDFWESEAARMIFYAIEILRIAYGKITPMDLATFIAGMANSLQDFGSEAFRKGFHFQTLQLAVVRSQELTEERKGDYLLAGQYWCDEIPVLNSKTKSSIVTHVNNLIHVFCMGEVRTLLGTETNVTPEATLNGKWLMVVAPVNELGDVGSFINTSWKYLTQKAVLRRVEGDTPIHCLWEDEAHLGTVTHDAPYANQSRKFRGGSAKISQSIPSFYARQGGTQRGKFQIDSLLAAFSHKVAFPVGDVDTATWLQLSVGSAMQTSTNVTIPPGNELDLIIRTTNVTSNIAEG